ncbi:hypothetical protein V3C99_017834 [Haemonchus contortus]
MIYVLEARLTESRNKLQKLAQKLGINPKRGEIAQRNGAKEDETKNQSTEDSEIDGDLAWLSEDMSDRLDNVQLDTEDAICRTLKPSQLKLPRFYGDEEDFPEYWAVFRTLVHDNKVLSTLEKMLLLKDSLRGRAEIAVKGIQLVPKNYNWMIEALEKKYGNKPINRAKIVQKLIDMRPAANNAAACNNVFDKIRMLINQMVSAGQDIRIAQDALWTEKILEKFPYSIVKNVLITTQSKDEVKIEDIMSELEKEIEAKKFVESRLRNFSKHDHNGGRQRYSSEELYEVSKACVFCKNTNHTSSYCRTVVGINERRDILKKEQLCWKCFADSHRSSECPKKNCSRCKQMHDVSVFFATGPVQKGNGSNDFNRPSSGFQPRNNIALEPRNPLQIRGERQPWNGNDSNDARNNRPFQGRATTNNACVNSDNTNNQATEAKEQIVLMTAEGSVWNYNTDQFEKVRCFFDTGAQKTLIRERTAQDLALPRQSREMCAVSGIGGHIERFQSDVVILKVLTAHGMEIDRKDQTKPIITSGFSSVNLSKEDKHFLQRNELWLCNPRVKGEHQTPQILVGPDYYYHLVPPDSKLIQLPSVLHIAKTVFGHGIHGRGIIPTQSNSSGIHERCRSLSNDSESKQLIQ